MKGRVSVPACFIKQFLMGLGPTRIAIAKSFFRYGTCSKNQIPPNPPFSKGGNYKELLEKSPFEKGGFRGI